MQPQQPLQPNWDVVILGAGLIGCELAWYLSQTQARVLVLEKEPDVAMGTTRANSAILHAGYDPKPGTLMARTNVRGNALAYQQCETLDIEHERTGSLVLAWTDQERKILEELFQRGNQNGVPGLELWERERILQEEPWVSSEVLVALYAPTAGIVNPWEWATALAEIAVTNGVELALSCAALRMERTADGRYQIETERGRVETPVVLNATGVHAAYWHSQVAEPTFGITPTKGEYYLLDRDCGELVRHVLFQCPNAQGKGVLVAPTVHGNVLVGPNAHEEADGEDVSNTAEGMAFVRSRALRSVPTLDFRQNIRNFAGMRANCDRGDFVVEFAAPGFLDLAGIQSPGLTAAPALAEYAMELLQQSGWSWPKREDWRNTRQLIRFKNLTPKQRAEQIAKNPLYGRVICRCETVTEGEIVDAIHGPIPCRTLDAVKRRTGAGLGRCQSGFCGPRVVEILARELGVPPQTIEQDHRGSYILTQETKGGAQ